MGFAIWDHCGATTQSLIVVVVIVIQSWNQMPDQLLLLSRALVQQGDPMQNDILENPNFLMVPKTVQKMVPKKVQNKRSKKMVQKMVQKRF